MASTRRGIFVGGLSSALILSGGALIEKWDVSAGQVASMANCAPSQGRIAVQECLEADANTNAANHEKEAAGVYGALGTIGTLSLMHNGDVEFFSVQSNLDNRAYMRPEDEISLDLINPA